MFTTDWLSAHPSGAYITPLKPNDQSLFERLSHSQSDICRYENSWFFIRQFLHREAYKFFDGQTLIAFGSDHQNPRDITIVRPVGVDISIKALTIARAITSLTHFNQVSVRYLNNEEYKAFLSVGFTDRGSKFPQVVCALKPLLEMQGGQWSKLRLRINRFRRHFEYTVQPLTVNSLHATASICQKWQQSYSQHYGGSTHRPPIINHYIGLMEAAAPYIDNQRTFGFLMMAEEIPLAVCLAVAVSSNCVAVYVNLCADYRPGLAETLLYDLGQMVYKQGYKLLNLGHSDLAGLHHFKLKFNPVQLNETFSVQYSTVS